MTTLAPKAAESPQTDIIAKYLSGDWWAYWSDPKRDFVDGVGEGDKSVCEIPPYYPHHEVKILGVLCVL